jgi:hypothetical protein
MNKKNESKSGSQPESHIFRTVVMTTLSYQLLFNYWLQFFEYAILLVKDRFPHLTKKLKSMERVVARLQKVGVVLSLFVVCKSLLEVNGKIRTKTNFIDVLRLSTKFVASLFDGFVDLSQMQLVGIWSVNEKKLDEVERDYYYGWVMSNLFWLFYSSQRNIKLKNRLEDELDSVKSITNIDQLDEAVKEGDDKITQINSTFSKLQKEILESMRLVFANYLPLHDLFLHRYVPSSLYIAMGLLQSSIGIYIESSSLTY